MAPPKSKLEPPVIQPRELKSFPKLPTEIRLMIWNLALPGPRVVDIRLRRRHEATSTGKIPDVSRYVSSLDHPAMLHACSESRFVALRHYELSFEKSTTTESSPAQTYINFSIDTVWFDHLPYFPSTRARAYRFPASDFSKIRYLALGRYLEEFLFSSTKIINPTYFPALEVIYQVTSPEGRPLYPVFFRPDRRYVDRRTKAKLVQLWTAEKKCPTIRKVFAMRIL